MVAMCNDGSLTVIFIFDVMSKQAKAWERSRAVETDDQISVWSVLAGSVGSMVEDLPWISAPR